ncbi:MAG TPA: HAMP domain-containing sensor histidine kinase [Ktedonobacteraceae bacterium]|jgi:signal transduction histidine kinase
MQVRREQHQKRTQAQIIEDLQRQVDELSSENLLLRDQLARKEQFTAMIAHELRGPLAPIINYAQMLARQATTSQNEGTPDEKKQQRRMATIQRQTSIIVSQARRLTRLVNDLLDASRLTSGQFTLFRESCDLAQLIRDTVEQLRPVAPYHKFHIETPLDKVIGNWDSGRLQQVLGNLLDNAIKYSDEQTTITIRLTQTPDFVQVSVHNQGASIPSSDISQLFRPYVRLQATSDRRGSGLGLYIAKSIIEAHAGTLLLEPHIDEALSEGPQGTTFSFTLPIS